MQVFNFLVIALIGLMGFVFDVAFICGPTAPNAIE
jgi:hypothetical protein